jgi:hypothetical protein
MTPTRINGASLSKTGGIAACTLGISYMLILVLYMISGPLPATVQDALAYFSNHAVKWLGIFWLSVLTDLLFAIVAFVLHKVLKDSSGQILLSGVGMLQLFVLLDLAITWPNYSSLLGISSKFAGADQSQRTMLLSAATYSFETLTSLFFNFYAILLPSLGIFFIGIAMRNSVFSKATAWIGVTIGMLGIFAVVGSLIHSFFGIAVVATSLLTTIWIFVVGIRLVQLSKS